MSRTTPQIESRIIRAGAGAGKTTRLISEVETLAESFFRKHERWPRLVLTTFTIKATQELRERLFLRSTQQTGAHTDHSLTEFVLSNQSLMITTIHGVLSQYLRSGAELIGWDPNFRFIDEAEDQRNAKTLLAELIFGATTSHLEILEEVRFQSLLTTLLNVVRKEWMHERFVPATTQDFENEAELLRADLKKLSGIFLERASEIPLTEGWTTTADLVRQIHMITAEPTFSWSEVRARFIELELDPKKPRISKKNPALPELEDALEDLREKLKESKEETWSPEIWKKIQINAQHIQELAEQFREKFWEQKRSSGALSLSDLEPLALRLAQLHPESAETFAQDWDYWLIDEYQDTSPLQNKLMDLFVKKSAVFYVGDPQQSIYYFRGARSEVFNTRFDSAGESQILQEELNTNYRSRPALMRFLNNFFAVGPNPFKTLDPGLKETASSDPEAIFYQCEEPSLEISSVCQRVLKLVNRGTGLDTIAIIARTNDDLYKISTELMNFGIPTRVHASSQFGLRREILDLRAICGFLLNPHDDEAAVSTLRTPWFYIDDHFLANAVKTRKTTPTLAGSSLWSLLQLHQSQLPSVKKLVELLDLLKQSSLSSALLKVLQENGIVDVSQVYDSTGQRESNIWKFVLLLKQAEHTPGFNAVDFLQQWSQLKSSLAEEGDAVAALEPNRINLMTIHASKGLQFDHVVVPFLSRSPRFSSMDFFESDESGRWSVKTKGADDELVSGPFHFRLSAQKRIAELEESDRLLYVAATRAKISVTFTLLMEPGRDSWHSRFQWNYSVGTHALSGFTYQVLNPPTDLESLTQKPVSSLVLVREKFPQAAVTTPSKRLAVSSMAEAKNVEAVKAEDNAAPKKIPKDFLLAPVRGMVFHQKMERIQKHLARFNGELAEDFCLETHEQWVLGLQEIPMKQILTHGQSEWPFQITFGTGRVSGQIDLWGQLEEEIWIVDYKTGTSSNQAKAMEQLQVYGWALRTANPLLHSIKLVALFPLEKKFFQEEFDLAVAQRLLYLASESASLS